MNTTIAAACGEWLLSQWNLMVVTHMYELREKGKTKVGGQTFEKPQDFDADKDLSMRSKIGMALLDPFSAGFGLYSEAYEAHNRGFSTTKVDAELNTAMLVDAMSAAWTGMPSQIIAAIKNTLTSAASTAASYEKNDQNQDSNILGTVQSYDWNVQRGSRVARLTFYSVSASSKQWSNAVKIGPCAKGKAEHASFKYRLEITNLAFQPRLVYKAMKNAENGMLEVMDSLATRNKEQAAAALGLPSDLGTHKAKPGMAKVGDTVPVDIDDDAISKFFTDK